MSLKRAGEWIEPTARAEPIKAAGCSEGVEGRCR
jgi:hypothetical protein